MSKQMSIFKVNIMFLLAGMLVACGTQSFEPIACAPDGSECLYSIPVDCTPEGDCTYEIEKGK